LDEEQIKRCEKDGWHCCATEIVKPQPAVRKLIDVALLLNGVDLPSGSQAWLSCQHEESHITFFAQALEKSIDLLRKLGAL